VTPTTPAKIKKLVSFTHPGPYSLVLAFVWTVIMALSLVASTSLLSREITGIAENVARAYIDKDIIYRKWNALHGGIYVPVNHGMTPNPFYPPSMPERDVYTPSGRHLTLVNPSYMMRQIYEFSQKEQGISGRITSLKPLRPENRATAWETEALRAFEQGKPERATVVMDGDVKYLQLMRPLVTEESCLACHGHQGYKRGDIRGGISVKFPMELLEFGMRQQFVLFTLGHGVLWLFGLFGLGAGYVGLKRRTKERDLALKKLKKVNELLESQASTDPVTGILNRRKFSEVLETELVGARRYGTRLALILFDIDHFKSINDTFGHDVGDMALKEVADLVSDTIRRTDIFARFGGEEFVILVHNNDTMTGCKLAEKIRSRLCEHDFPQVGMVTCSFGVAQLNAEDTAETLIRRADEAMYAAKHAGRNRVQSCCFLHAALPGTGNKTFTVAPCPDDGGEIKEQTSNEAC